MWGNGSADGTMLLIYDPWPPGVGSTYAVFYGERVTGVPLGTVKSRSHRAHRKLAARLGHLRSDTDE